MKTAVARPAASADRAREALLADREPSNDDLYALVCERLKAASPAPAPRRPAPRRAALTVRRAAVAAMRSKRSAGEKPAGWRYFNDLYWQRSGEKKCKECLRTSLLSDQPVASHLRSCSIFKSLPRLLGPRPGPLPSLSPPVVVRTAAALRPVPKPAKPVRYAVFLAFVRRRPCRFCARAAPSEPHHFGPRGHSQKTGDLRAAPLCVSDLATGYEGHHDYYHRTSCLPGMNRAQTKAWLNEAILEVHDAFFGAWVRAGEPPATPEEQALLDCLNEGAAS